MFSVFELFSKTSSDCNVCLTSYFHIQCLFYIIFIAVVTGAVVEPMQLHWAPRYGVWAGC